MTLTPPPNEPGPEPPADADEPLAADLPAGAVCAVCGITLGRAYFGDGRHLLCPRCAEAYPECLPQGGGARRLLKAGVFGAGGAVVGTLLYWGVARATGYEVGLIAIFVGLIVGLAVRVGSEQRGGWAYRLLAMWLTYTTIGASYFLFMAEEIINDPNALAEAGVVEAGGVPEPTEPVVSEAPDGAMPMTGAVEPGSEPGAPGVAGPDAPPGPLDWLLFAVLCILLVHVLPVLVVFEAGLTLLFIAIALYEAWKLNAPQQLTLIGPIVNSAA